MRNSLPFLVLILLVFTCMFLAARQLTGSVTLQQTSTTTYAYAKGLVTQNTAVPVFIHADYLGSTRLLTDEKGTASNSFISSPFGETLSTSPSADSSRFLFTGKELDESGLQYFGARYYDARIGRFVSSDPIGGVGELYGYSRENPLAFTDPNGAAPKPVETINDVSFSEIRNLVSYWIKMEKDSGKYPGTKSGARPPKDGKCVDCWNTIDPLYQNHRKLMASVSADKAGNPSGWEVMRNFMEPKGAMIVAVIPSDSLASKSEQKQGFLVKTNQFEIYKDKKGNLFARAASETVPIDRVIINRGDGVAEGEITTIVQDNGGMALVVSGPGDHLSGAFVDGEGCLQRFNINRKDVDAVDINPDRVVGPDTEQGQVQLFNIPRD
ncbi:MAG: RHS repeat-associated core domain-containing protein [Candidatus Woesearchaeota archaeon]